MPARKRAQEAKKKDTLTVYRVFIDYEAAGINTSYTTSQKKIYENKAGVNAKIRAALEMGVHPRFIHVQEVKGDWKDSEDYTGICLACGSMFQSPSPDCPQMQHVEYLNAQRAQHARPHIALGRTPGTGGMSKYLVQLELPHPAPYTIEEIPA